jgi:hypothetical protein
MAKRHHTVHTPPRESAQPGHHRAMTAQGDFDSRARFVRACFLQQHKELETFEQGHILEICRCRRQIEREASKLDAAFDIWVRSLRRLSFEHSKHYKFPFNCRAWCGARSFRGKFVSPF